MSLLSLSLIQICIMYLVSGVMEIRTSVENEQKVIENKHEKLN